MRNLICSPIMHYAAGFNIKTGCKAYEGVNIKRDTLPQKTAMLRQPERGFFQAFLEGGNKEIRKRAHQKNGTTINLRIPYVKESLA